MGKVPFIDTTGKAYFRNIIQHYKNQGDVLLISGAQSDLKTTLTKNGLYAEIGIENFFEHTGEAINCALKHLNKGECLGCKHFAFHECARLSQQCQEVNSIKKKSKALEF